ncbi:MAG: replication factor A, partial [Halapricum sp.]
MRDVTQHAQEIHEQLPADADIDLDEIETRLETLVNEYKVPMQEARRSVISTYLDETGTDRDDLQSDNQEVDIVDIDEPDQWVDLTAKVVDLWEPRSDSIAQVG